MIGSIFGTGSNQRDLQRKNNIKSEMVLTAYLLALILIWRGVAVTTVASPCNQDMFDSNIDNCLSDFNKSMETSGYEDRCPWPTVKSFYNKLMFCVGDWANLSGCKGQAFLVDKVFLRVHQTYFSLCRDVHDPPLTTLIMLIVPPIIATLSFPFLCVHVTP